MEGRVKYDPVRTAAMCAETAYDVDAVCEEIHKIFQCKLDAIFDQSANDEVPAGKADWILNANKKICEIVRNGGKKA